MSGPVGKRDAERRRRNKPIVPTTTVNLAETTAQEVEIPEANPEWHEVATLWYESLAKSGQAIFYEPSDWATAYLIAESLSRDLDEQVVGITDDGQVVRDTIPMKGASLSAYLKAMTVLLVTEGDRRRAKMEIERANAKLPTEAELAEQGVASISQTRDARFRRDA